MAPDPKKPAPVVETPLTPEAIALCAEAQEMFGEDVLVKHPEIKTWIVRCANADPISQMRSSIHVGLVGAQEVMSNVPPPVYGAFVETSMLAYAWALRLEFCGFMRKEISEGKQLNDNYFIEFEKAGEQYVDKYLEEFALFLNSLTQVPATPAGVSH